MLQPSLETEFRTALKQKADEEAINVFAENLRQLLLSSPLGSKRFWLLIRVIVQVVKLFVLMRKAIEKNKSDLHSRRQQTVRGRTYYKAIGMTIQD